jgi:hypothetical protein
LPVRTSADDTGRLPWPGWRGAASSRWRSGSARAGRSLPGRRGCGAPGRLGRR